MKVNAEIINTPKGIKIHQWIVARRDPDSAELWWYGTYDDEEYAYSVAQEIGNGIVLEDAGLSPEMVDHYTKLAEHYNAKVHRTNA